MSATKSAAATGVLSRVPAETLEWLLAPENPAVAVLTRRTLLGQDDDAATAALWARRNEYAPVSAIIEAQQPDGSWAAPSQDYRKYEGSLWQIVFLGELWADAADERVRRGADYAFSRQLADGSWSASNALARGSIPCLTANVGRSLARLGFAEDERVVAALRYCTDLFRDLGIVDCQQAAYCLQLNGYCHMLTVKALLFLSEVPPEAWPDGAEPLRDACIAALRDKQVVRSLPAEAREFNDAMRSMPASQRQAFRDGFLGEHEPLHYGDKPGWLRFGFPLSYNSDVLEALVALAAVGETRRPEYEPALALVESACDEKMRWPMKNSFNGKMIADVEVKGRPSKWLTLRALTALSHFGR